MTKAVIMKKAVLILALVALLLPLMAQFEDDFSAELSNSGRQAKSAKRAMLYSMLLPGAGQFYVDKSAFTTYVFPVVELALLGGIFYYTSQGNDQTQEYQDYATKEIITITNDAGDVIYTGPRYSRDRQKWVQSALIGINQYDIYTPDIYTPDQPGIPGFFRLDGTNTQHFYEDIGKYNKYIFGWTDWYYTFAADENGTFMLGTLAGGEFSASDPNWNDPYGTYPSVWVMSNTDVNFAYQSVWISNHTVENYQEYLDLVATDPDAAQTYLQSPVSPSSPLASPLRKQYIEMRQDAEASYSAARAFGFGLIVNHIASSLDALRLAKKWNRYVITQNSFNLNYYTAVKNDKLTPSVMLSYRF